MSKLIYVVEIKFNKSAKTALKQIKEKEYFLPFLSSGKEIRLVGLGFKRTTQKQGKSKFTITVESKLI